MANWLFNFIVSLTFLLLIDALGRGGAFFFYAAICVVTFFFCKRLVPETKGKRLEDITAVFEERVARHSGAPPPTPLRRVPRPDCIAGHDPVARAGQFQGARGPSRARSPTRTCATCSRPTPIAATG